MNTRRLALLAVLLLSPLTSCGGEPTAPDPAAVAPGRPPGFEEVAEAAGIDFRMTYLESEQGATFKINLYDHGTGACAADYDGDGLDDLYFVNQLGPNGLFRNNGDGTFTETTDEAGLAVGDRICSSAAFADYDNDGDQDLFIASTRGGNLLFRNDGRGRFADVTEAAGVALVAHSQGCTFFDHDLDGDLDLFVTNTAKWTLEVREEEFNYFLGRDDLAGLVRSPHEKNAFYRNEGDGTFVDVTGEVGLTGVGWGGDMAVLDYDEDGDPDLFLTNMFGIQRLYRNEGGRTFTDVSEETFTKTSWGAVACKVIDFDGDARLDLLVSDMHSDMWMPLTWRPAKVDETIRWSGPEGPVFEYGLAPGEQQEDYWMILRFDPETAPRLIFGSTLYRALGGGRFEEVSAQAGIETLWPWGLGVADFDLDGYEDYLIASGMGYPYFPWPNAVMMNQRDGTFAKRSVEEGLEPRPGGPWLPDKILGQPAAKSSRSIGILDYDGDGRLDAAINNFNERAYLYRNRFPMRHWAAFRLRGTKSNRDAIGAVVRIEAGGRAQIRQVCGAGGYLGQSTRTLHFGLGDAAAIDRVEIRWPCGARQVLTGLAADRVHDVVEPAEGR